MVIALVLLIAAPTPAELLESKQVKQRIEAIRLIVQKGDAQAEELLLKALDDRDWEVVHRAAEALGTRGTKLATNPLVDLATKGSLRRIRLAAARSLKKLNAAEAGELIGRRLKSPALFEAAEALAVLGEAGGTKILVRMLKNKETLKRAAAVKALGSRGQAERIELWTRMLSDPDILVRVEVIGALVKTGAKQAIAPLRDRLKRAGMPQVMQRRYIDAIRRLIGGLKEEKERNFAATMCARTFGMAGDGDANARFARLLGSLGRKRGPVGPVDEYIKTLMNAAWGHADLRVRRAAVAALARIGREQAAERVTAVASSDSAWQVRFQALRAALKLRGEKALPLVLDRIRHDDHKWVREEAATIAGNMGRPESVRTLIAALRDKEWEVCVCASVSLGKLHAQEGVAPLIELTKHASWRRRGGAVAGLGRIRSKRAVPVLIGMLRDRQPAVAASAREYLRHIAGKKIDAKPRAFRDWWARHGAKFQFTDPDRAAREAKKYGYAVTRRGVYEDLDIIVLQTRKGGDNIQFLLKDYGVEHRIVRAASVAKAALTPFALFVANCPGEIVDKDVDQIQWFVRTGGYLFASCWALTHTVQRAFPEIADKLPLKGQVIGTVAAEPLPSDSPYLKDVFDGVTSPLYELMGSHLIRVLDPERFEVLIDSPHAATIWGDGNLAGWFTVGHGTILDSANHFDLQGMKNARVRTEKERMAFAMDHLGYEYAELRKLQAEGVFRKGPEAARRTRDLSIFRFITTFVRQKRLADEE